MLILVTKMITMVMVMMVIMMVIPNPPYEVCWGLWNKQKTSRPDDNLIMMDDYEIMGWSRVVMAMCVNNDDLAGHEEAIMMMINNGQ